MELEKIAIRALLAYLFLHVMMRLSGKRMVAQGSSLDFICVLILGDMIDDVLWSEVPVSQFVVGSGTLLFVHAAAVLASWRSPWVDRILSAQSRVFMRNGTLLKPTLRAEKVNDREAEEMIRISAGLEREEWKQVKSAWVESNGRPSAIRHEWAREAQGSDLEQLRRRRSRES